VTRGCAARNAWTCGRFVGREIVSDYMDLPALGLRADQVGEEGHEFAAGVALGGLVEDRAGLRFQRRPLNPGNSIRSPTNYCPCGEWRESSTPTVIFGIDPMQLACSCGTPYPRASCLSHSQRLSREDQMSGLPKRKLTLEDLRVESFVTTPQSEWGTVHGLDDSCATGTCGSRSCDGAGITCPPGCTDFITCCFNNESCCTATCAT
jgi:hypothetical protein